MEHHTTSFSIADRDGNVICVTQSLGSPFGSGVVVPGTGLCLNNFLYWIDLNPNSPNHTQAGDALPICMAPTVSLRDGKPVLALGTPGSYGILQTQAQAMVQYLDFGLPLQDAIEQPRARLWDGRQVEPETRIAPAVLKALGARGHDIDAGRGLDHAGRRHAGGRDRSRQRTDDRRLRSAPRQLCRDGLKLVPKV